MTRDEKQGWLLVVGIVLLGALLGNLSVRLGWPEWVLPIIFITVVGVATGAGLLFAWHLQRKEKER